MTAADRSATGAQGDRSDLCIPLPCDVRLGAAIFRKGVSLAVFVRAAQRHADRLAAMERGDIKPMFNSPEEREARVATMRKALPPPPAEVCDA